MKKSVLFSSLLVLFCLMLSCKKTPTAPEIPDATQTSVTVTSTNSTIWVGQTEQMTAKVNMSDGSTKTATGTWSSDNTAVATVSSSGLVTGISAGTATISCTEGGMSGTKLITVRSIWSKSGVGADVFDMPTYVSRVKITGEYTGYVENFVVWIGSDLVVNEILGTASGYSTTYSGTFLTSGGVVEVKYSNGLSWSFTEVPVTTALTNSTRKIPVITDPSDPRYRQYEIYKHEAAKIK